MSKKDWLKGELYPYANAYFMWIEGDKWRVSEGVEAEGLGRHCYFKLSGAPEDLKNWIMLGLTMEPNQLIYNPDYIDCVRNRQYFFVQRLPANTLSIYIPVTLLKQIKPLEEEPT